MQRRTCNGCGRLLSLRSRTECHCWQSVKPGASIPYRLRTARKRVIQALAMNEGAGKEAVVRKLEVFLDKGLEG